jgi:hypothetical protein
MVEIGQVVKDFKHNDDKYVMLWEGDPFNRKKQGLLPPALQRHMERMI